MVNGEKKKSTASNESPPPAHRGTPFYLSGLVAAAQLLDGSVFQGREVARLHGVSDRQGIHVGRAEVGELDL